MCGRQSCNLLFAQCGQLLIIQRLQFCAVESGNLAGSQGIDLWHCQCADLLRAKGFKLIGTQGRHHHGSGIGDLICRQCRHLCGGQVSQFHGPELFGAEGFDLTAAEQRELRRFQV